MPTQTWSPSPLYRDAPAPTIALAEEWGGDWEDQDFLYCDSFTQCSNPEIPQAMLSWRYGILLRPGKTSYESVDPLDGPNLLGQYVRITLLDPNNAFNSVVWYGVIEAIVDDVAGTIENALDPDGEPIQCGRQVVQCLGLESLLEKVRIVASTYLNSTTGAEVEVERGIQFNDVKYQKEFGNKSPSDGAKGAPLFGDDISTAELWSTDNILNYLLAYYAPSAGAGGGPLSWALSEASDNANFYFDDPRLTSDRRSVKSLLDTLIDRRRLIGYIVAPGADGTTIELNMFTFTPTDLTFGLDTITANANQVAIDVSGSPDVDHQTLRIVGADQWDQVYVVGAPALACVSLSGPDNTLVPHWTVDDQNDYNTAASTAPDYPSDIYLQVQRNEVYRSQDRLKRVYSYFGLDPSWDGKVMNGEGTGGEFPYLPQDDDVSKPRAFYYPGLRFVHHLPLLLNHDYSGTKIKDGSVGDTTPPGQCPEYLPMFVVAQVPPDPGGMATSWQYGERFSRGFALERYNPNFSIGCRPEEDSPGIVLTVPQPQMIANADFVPLPADSDFTEQITIDWSTQMIVTVCIQADAPASAIWPKHKPNVQFLRKLVIDVGAEAQWHYVAPNTIVGLEDGQLVRSTSGGSIRDDRPRLLAIAQFAYSWYSQPRQVLELSFNLCVFGLSVGQLVTNLHDSISDPPVDSTINTVITRIHREFPEAIGGRQPPSPRTTITTAMGQLDGLYRDALRR